MFWHWMFSITAGALAGWSLARWLNPQDEQPAQGDLLRGVLSLAAIIGFTYNGWAEGLSVGLATLAACLAAAGTAYGIGRLRVAQLRAQDGAGGVEPDEPAVAAEPEE